MDPGIPGIGSRGMNPPLSLSLLPFCPFPALPYLPLNPSRGPGVVGNRCKLPFSGPGGARSPDVLCILSQKIAFGYNKRDAILMCNQKLT